MSTDIVDLEALVEAWALQLFLLTRTKDQTKIAQDHLRFTVDWRRVRFRDAPPVYDEPDAAPTPRASVLFRTSFENRTSQEQEYSLKAERVTRSTCVIEIERGVSTGYEMSVKLAMPCEVFEANAGFKKELTLTSTHSQTFEEELTWGVNSQIRVPSQHVTTAEMVVTESGYASRFSVASSCEGRVHVTVTNVNDNNSFVKTLDGGISEIVSQRGAPGCRVDGRIVHFETRGRCHFRYGIEQRIRLEQRELDT